MILTAVLLALLILMLWGVGRLRGDLLTRGPVKLALFPGLIFDAMARTLSCLATATPVMGISPWKDETPFLVESECSLKRIGVPLTTVLRVGVLFVAFSSTVFYLPEMMSVVPAPGSLQQSLEFSVSAFGGKLLSAPIDLLSSGMATWGILAWLGAMVLAAGLSGRESLAALGLVALLAGALEGAHWLGLRFGTFTNGWFLRRFYEDEAGRSLVLLVLVTSAVLALLATMHLVPMLVAKIRPRPSQDYDQEADQLVSPF